MSTTTVPEPNLSDAVGHTLMASEVTHAQDLLKGKLRAVVVTPERAVLDEVVEMVVLPMFDGELGVLPGRAALIGRLGAGELRLKTDATVKRFFIEPGFAQVRENVVTVLTARAVASADVTPAVVEKAAADAAGLPAGNAVERANKTRAADRALGLKKVAAKNV